MQGHHLLDDVSLTAIARARAEAQMRRAEFVVALVARGATKTRLLGRAIQRRAVGLARHVQSALRYRDSALSK